MGTFEELKVRLSDKRWRLTSWRLYNIKDKDWKKIPFIPNKHQIKLYLAMMKYDLIVIPKARQLWFSTAMQIWILDDFLFRRNCSFGVIARTRDDAIDLYENKIKFAWENFPDVLKFDSRWIPRRVMDTDKANQMSCANTFSKIRVSTTFRWGTLQLLHVSEFWPICAESPEQAKEIVDWAFEAVSKNNKIVLESTSAGAEWEFFDICMLAKKVTDEWREPEPMEWKLLFFPRWEEEEYAIDINAPLPEELVKYFDNLENDHWIVLKREQKLWYAKKKETKKERMMREYPSTFEECFAMVLEWTYYEREITITRRDRRICAVPYDENLEVHTAWDLWWAGWWDDMTIVFFQLYGKEIRFIDCREGNWVSLVWCINNVIAKKQYNYWKHYAPHDIMVTELTSGETRREAAKKAWIKFEVLPISKKLSNDIELIRNNFTNCWFDLVKCDTLIKKLSNYRRKRHTTMRIHLDEPMKNGAQHMADWFRYAMLAVYEENRNNDDAVIIDIIPKKPIDLWY